MSSTVTTIIKPHSEQKLGDGIKELWRYRELLWTFAIRNISVRYKQTILGLAWVVLQPVLTTAIFTFVFGYLARVPSSGVPYPAFVFSGLLLWQYFSRCVTEGSSSLQTHSGMLAKVYFPRMLMLMVAPLSAALDFGVALCVLLALMTYYSVLPHPAALLFVPLLLGLTGLLGFAISLVLAPLSIKRRDIMVALPFMLQMGMYLTPIIYPVAFVPKKFHWIFLFNPLATLLDGIRWILLGNPPPHFDAWLVLTGILMILLLLGRWLFRRNESTMVDKL